MNITLIAVGKLKERWWHDACCEYLKRLGAYARVKVVEVADREPATYGGDAAAREAEASDILKALGEGVYVVLLAIEGTPRSSEGFSAHLDELALHGRSAIAFIIGSSTGVAPRIVQRADETLSFGAMTLPHNLARVVLLEQVYRAFKISRGEPYHK